MDRRRLIVLTLAWIQLSLHLCDDVAVVYADSLYKDSGRYRVVSCADKGGINNTALVSESMTKIRIEVTARKEAAESAAFYSYRDVAIDADLFNKQSVRLNTEIYEETAQLLDKKHIQKEFGDTGSDLYNSYLERIDPLMPLALSICETGMWADTRYTWSSAIYTKLLSNKGVQMSKLRSDRVDVDTYVVNDLCEYLGCGSNCTGGAATHYHVIGNNDNDSLGPLQILRHYVEKNGCIKYACGESTSDLMCWHDNVEYFLHKQSSAFSNGNVWNSGHEIKSDTELMALIAVAHNTGSAYLTSKSAGSLWRSSECVYDYCELLGSEKAFRVMETYIDEWYSDVEERERNNESYVMAGTALSGKYDEILMKIGVNKSTYANGWAHKQYYPLKAVLNYMALERLYFSQTGEGNYG